MTMQESGLDETLIQTIAVQILQPLSKLHSAGRVFKDLKAKNIMITPEGNALLQVFTIPSILQERAPMFRHSVYWFAPELLTEKASELLHPRYV